MPYARIIESESLAIVWASSSQDVHVAAMDLLSVWGDLVVADKGTWIRVSQDRDNCTVRRIWGKEVLDTLEEIVHPPRTALLVVDVQNDFCHPQGFYGRTGEDLGEIEATIPKIERLVEAGRGAGLLVVWIKQVLLPEAAADSGAWLRFRTRATVAHGLAGDEGANRQTAN